MFVIFGWEKTAKQEMTLLETYCYHCRNDAKWDLYTVTEWVSFFFVRVIPFFSKKFLCCSICGDNVELNAKAYRQVRVLANGGHSDKTRKVYEQAANMLEAHQLADKTETQRNFIRATRNASR